MFYKLIHLLDKKMKIFPIVFSPYLNIKLKLSMIPLFEDILIDPHSTSV